MTLVPLVIAVLVMISGLASPQFGLMEHRLITTEGIKIREGNFSMGYDHQACPNPVWFLLGT